MKELLGMNPLLITVEDFFTMTEAGKHNLKNISEAFGCNIISFKPNRRAAKIISRYMFEKYGRPLWYVDRLLYTVPLYYAADLKFRYLCMEKMFRMSMAELMMKKLIQLESKCLMVLHQM